MQMSEAGLNLIKEFESCKLIAYQDVRGIWTIGWGATGNDVVESLVWTQNQADARLLQDVQNTVTHVNSLVTVSITQGNFDAICSFAYNVGCGALAGSQLLRLLNSGNVSGASLEFPKWSHANGVVIPGLLRRRLAEQALFSS
jgi:lysozyme